MKLTKKIVSLAAVLALSCTFAVSAATFNSTTAAVEAKTDGYSVTVPVTAAEANDQYTILVYRIGDNGVFDLVTGAAINAESGAVQAAPSNSTITYINQDSFGTITPDVAYTLAFALGANVNSNGQYKVLVGGTGVTTAAVGYFEVGAAAPTYKYGDVIADGEITIDDALEILKVALGGDMTFEKAVGDVIADGEITIDDALNTLKVALGDDSIVLGPNAN